MKRRLLNLIIPCVFAIAAIIITVSLVFGVKQPNTPKKISMPDETGKSVYGVCIADLAEKNYLRYAYYTPDKFVMSSNAVSGELVDLSSHKCEALRGTYQFVVYNIDPDAEDFLDQSNKLKPYLQSDNSWHFSVYMPPVFSSCVIYDRAELVSECGKIADYDYIAFSDKQGYSPTHEDGTQPEILDLSFYSRREAIGAEFHRRAMIITVHFEGNSVKSGFDGIPMIGATDTIESTVSTDKVTLTWITLAAAFIFAVLAFACILKKSAFAIPQAAMTFGLTGFSGFKLVLYWQTSAPMVSYIGIPLCVGIVVAAAALSVVYAILRHKSEFLATPPIAVVFGITYICLTLETPILPNPVIWLAVMLFGITAFSAFKFFADLEMRNEYLTNNLKSEVSRQTADLKAIISERDKLLRYMSHDMKKPVSSIQNFIAEIRRAETNAENIKALDIIDGKLDTMQADFAELQKFAKLNFTAEESETIYTDELSKSIYKRLSPDCEANGILLKYTSPQIAVFAKRGILTSVIDNLVFNAIEHSQCKTIVISASKNYEVCTLTVADDGKGIENGQEVFVPYHSENADGENLGLGLYICRQHMLSMGGDLKYSRENNLTVFTVTLPPA